MFVIIGYLLAMGCIFGGYIMHGGNIKVVLEALPNEMLVIGGGAIGLIFDQAAQNQQLAILY